MDPLLAGLRDGYIDEIGLVQSTYREHSGNPLLYTAEAVVRLAERGSMTDELRAQFLAGIERCEIEPGYYRRHPTFFSGDQERQDDYIALAVLSKYLNAPKIAQDILVYGRTHKKRVLAPLPWPSVSFYFPNEEGWDAPFNPRAWIGWYTACIATLKVAAGETLSPSERRSREYAIAYGPNRKDTTDRDSYILAWLILSVGETDSWVKDAYRRQLLLAYPGGISDLLHQYFLDKNHPLGLY